MSDNIAVLEGYTREMIAEYMDLQLFLLIKPDTDLTSRFRAWDTERQGFIKLNGWKFEFQDI